MSAFVVYAGSGLSTIDAKGRVTIPAELRDTVAESSGENIVCISRHPNLPCLIGYGRAERQKLRADIEAQWQAAVQRGGEFDRESAGVVASSIFETAFENSGFVISASWARKPSSSARPRISCCGTRMCSSIPPRPPLHMFAKSWNIGWANMGGAASDAAFPPYSSPSG